MKNINEQWVITWRVGNQRKVNARIRDQIGLELSEIHVEGAIETERGGDRGDNLANQTVQVGVCGALNVQVATADVVDGLIVDHEGAVRVLQSGVGGQNTVVRLNDGGGDLRGRVNGKLQLALLAVVHRETLHQEASEATARAAAERVEDQEALQASTLVAQLANAICRLQKIEHVRTLDLSVSKIN